MPALLVHLEACALDSLNHPNIVKVLDFGQTASGAPFLALERLRGGTLAQELRSKRPPGLEQALLDVGQMLSGLGAAHSLGLVHRDVKPSNIFAHYTARKKRRIKLLDFGVVKMLGGSPLRLTTGGMTVGTPRYMSPEQACAEEVDARSDLYATALVLYRLVAGRGPFDHHGSDQEVFVARLTETPRPPSRFAPGPLPKALDEVILKALQTEPEDRFQSAAEFAEALMTIAHALGGETLSMAFAKSSVQPLSSELTRPTVDQPSPTSTAPLSLVLPSQSVLPGHTPCHLTPTQPLPVVLTPPQAGAASTHPPQSRLHPASVQCSGSPDSSYPTQHSPTQHSAAPLAPDPPHPHPSSVPPPQHGAAPLRPRCTLYSTLDASADPDTPSVEALQVAVAPASTQTVPLSSPSRADELGRARRIDLSQYALPSGPNTKRSEDE